MGKKQNSTFDNFLISYFVQTERIVLEDTRFKPRPEYRSSIAYRDLPQPLYANMATALLVMQHYYQKRHFLTITWLSINQSLLQHC
jgi:hypothetical protein